jgi:amphi-Trp domain-containing protein
MSHQHLKVKATSGLPQIIRHLECLIQSLKKGSISISTNRDDIFLKPHEPISLKLQTETKPGKDDIQEKLVIEMKWEKNEEPIRENVMFDIDHSCTPEIDDQKDLKEIIETAIMQDKREHPIMHNAAPKKKAIPDLLETSSRKKKTPTRKSTIAGKDRAASHKSGSR